MDDFLDWATVLCIADGGDGSEKRRRYVCYRLWAKLLRARRSPYKQDARFDFDEPLKEYLRHLTGGDVTDAPPPPGAVRPSSANFVKYVVCNLDDCF